MVEELQERPDNPNWAKPSSPEGMMLQGEKKKYLRGIERNHDIPLMDSEGQSEIYAAIGRDKQCQPVALFIILQSDNVVGGVTDDKLKKLDGSVILQNPQKGWIAPLYTLDMLKQRQKEMAEKGYNHDLTDRAIKELEALGSDNANEKNCVDDRAKKRQLTPIM